jgi:hypothetical protein
MNDTPAANLGKKRFTAQELLLLYVIDTNISANNGT